jgi:hypothetical protein
VELLFVFFAGRNALFIKDSLRKGEEGYNFSFFSFFCAPSQSSLAEGLAGVSPTLDWV